MDEESSNTAEGPEQRCKNCGKPVEKGSGYCAECKTAVRTKIDGMVSITRPPGYRARHPQGRWVVYSLTGVVILLAAVAAAMVLAIPRDKEFTSQAQASICRSNLRSIETAVHQYYAATGESPPAGRVDRHHPLVMDQYLKEAPRCPATHHYYLVENTGRMPAERCDSGLAGHEL